MLIKVISETELIKRAEVILAIDFVLSKFVFFAEMINGNIIKQNLLVET